MRGSLLDLFSAPRRRKRSMARICRTLQGRNRAWRRPFSNHLLHYTTWLGKQEVVYLPSPVVGQLGLRVSKCSVFNTCSWRDCTITTLIEVENYYTKRENACGHQKCSPVADIFLHRGCCNTRKRTRIHTPVLFSLPMCQREECQTHQ